MIELNTGRPGAGKTYRVVHRMLNGDTADKYSIFHNITGLKAALIGDGSHCHYWPDIPGFLTYDKQVEIAEYERAQYDRPVLVIIDEAQRWFSDRNPDLKKWMSYHRHLGQDIWLICQHYKMIYSDYYNLCEYECRAKKGIMLNQMIYQYMVGGERWKTQKVKTSKVTFAAYTSFDQKGAKQGQSKLPLYILGAVLLTLGSIVALVYKGIPSAFAKMDDQQPSKQIEKGKKQKKVVEAPARGVPKESSLSVVGRVSYAGVVGDRVLVQDAQTGSVQLLDDVPGVEEYYIVEYGSRWVRILTLDGKIIKIVVRKIESRETTRPTGGQARASGSGQGGEG